MLPEGAPLDSGSGAKLEAPSSSERTTVAVEDAEKADEDPDALASSMAVMEIWDVISDVTSGVASGVASGEVAGEEAELCCEHGETRHTESRPQDSQSVGGSGGEGRSADCGHRRTTAVCDGQTVSDLAKDSGTTRLHDASRLDEAARLAAAIAYAPIHSNYLQSAERRREEWLPPRAAAAPWQPLDGRAISPMVADFEETGAMHLWAASRFSAATLASLPAVSHSMHMQYSPDTIASLAFLPSAGPLTALVQSASRTAPAAMASCAQNGQRASVLSSAVCHDEVSASSPAGSARQARQFLPLRRPEAQATPSQPSGRPSRCSNTTCTTIGHTTPLGGASLPQPPIAGATSGRQASPPPRGHPSPPPSLSPPSLSHHLTDTGTARPRNPRPHHALLSESAEWAGASPLGAPHTQAPPVLDRPAPNKLTDKRMSPGKAAAARRLAKPDHKVRAEDRVLRV